METYSEIPNDIPEAIDYLQRQHTESISSTEANAPSPDAPVGQQIAFALRAKRLEAEGEFIDELIESYTFSKIITGDK